MSRIVFTSIGSLGDLYPLIAIALELKGRGHEIVFATAKDYQAKVESLGFEFSPLRPALPSVDDPEAVALLMDLQRGTERLLRDYLFASIRETYADLLPVAQTADFMVAHEVIYAAPIVAEKLNMRWASTILSPGSFLSAYDPTVLAPFPALAKLRSLGPLVNGRIRDFIRVVSQSWGEPVHQLRRELGLSAIGNPLLDNKLSPYLVLALFSSAFASPQPDWAKNTVITGFSFYDAAPPGFEPSSDWRQFLSEGEPPIVFTLGSAAVMIPGDFYQESIRAVEQFDRRAVLLIGPNPIPDRLPDDILAIDYLPHSQIFPHASAIVHQGGIGTTAQGLRSGHPTLVVPYSHDQPDNAARLERLGTSKTIPRQKYAAARVVKALSELLNDDRYHVRAAAVAQMVRAENGVGTACDRIERELQTIT